MQPCSHYALPTIMCCLNTCPKQWDQSWTETFTTPFSLEFERVGLWSIVVKGWLRHVFLLLYSMPLTGRRKAILLSVAERQLLHQWSLCSKFLLNLNWRTCLHKLESSSGAELQDNLCDVIPDPMCPLIPCRQR